MKKIKTCILLILCLCLSPLFFACDKTVKVESITLNVQEIVLRPGESASVEATIGPKNATNKDIDFILADNSVATLTVDENNQYLATVTASSTVTGTFVTYLQAVSKDESETRSEAIKITVYSEKTALFTPNNLTYDYDNHIISWDEIESASGYMLYVDVEGEEPIELPCAVNKFKIDEFYHKIISVKVKALGDDIIYTDSEYSTSTFKFIQPEEPKNLRNDGAYIKFDRVENCKQYNLFVYDKDLISGDTLPNVPHYAYNIDDLTFDSEVGYYLDLLENAGKTFIIKVQAIAKDFEDVTEYPSKSVNSIIINKIDTPKVNAQDFKFTYANKTLSWEALPYATKYIVTRSGTGENKVYNLDSDINYLVIDTLDDKLEAGSYYYTLKIFGNNTTYLDSNTSNSIQIDKLSAPTLKVENGIVVWNEVLNCSGYYLKIDDNNFTYYQNPKKSFELDSSYIAKQYSFVIKAAGNGVNSITSEESEVLTTSKLKAPEKAFLQNNKNLVFNGTSFVDTFEIHLTYNSQSTTKITKNNLDSIQDGQDIVKQTQVDMTKANYNGGSYSVYAVAYAQGYLYSERSESFTFTKLNNTNEFKIDDGKLSYSIDSVTDAKRAEVYINDELVFNASEGLFDSETYDFIPGQDYVVQLRYFPEINTDIVISNFTDVFTVNKLRAPDELKVEYGEIIFSTPNSFGNKFFVTKKGTIETNKYSSISNIVLEEDVVYTIKMRHEGGNQYLNSNFSNEISVQLLGYVDDLKISNDVISFTSIGANNYYINFEADNTQYDIDCRDYYTSFDKDLKGSNSFRLSTLVKEALKDYINYNNLSNNALVYMTYDGGTLQNPVGNEDIVTFLNRSSYSSNLEDKSNELTLKILPSPKNFRTTQLIDLLETSNIDINELYFDAPLASTMFELTYTNTSTKNVYTKLLTTDNYLKKVGTNQGVVTYKVDTSFLTNATYNLQLQSVAPSKIDSNPQNNKVIYNINSFDIINLNNVTKIKPVTSLSCSNGKIIINDSDTSYIYLLTINGETIYDDILEENQTFDDIVSEALSALSSANTDAIDDIFAKIKQFQTKERVLKNKYSGTFNVNCYKMKVPLELKIGVLELLQLAGMSQDERMAFIKNKLNTGNNIKSDLTTSIKVTRVKETTPTLKNGVLYFTPVENATSYDIYLAENVDDKYNFSLIKSINSNEALEYDLYSHLNGKVGNYQVYVMANTTKNNYLSGNRSAIIDFEILSAPTLKIESGKLVWNAIQNANGYKLNIYSNNEVFDSFEFDRTTLEYDAMIKSNGITIVPSGNYKFEIMSLGEINGREESSVLSSLISSPFEATKLSTPIKIEIKNGKLLLTNVDNHTGVECYKLNIGNSYETIEFDTNNIEFELPEKYAAGEYTFTYQAVAGDTNYLTSNLSNEAFAEKLKSTSKVYIQNGEIYWNGVEVENYKNSTTESVIYNVDIKREESVKNFNSTTTAYILSADDEVEAGMLYNLSVKTLGDSFYYLNSNDKVLEKVAKLDYIKDFKIEGGKLVWTNPAIVSATQNYTKASPNGLYFTFTINGKKIYRTIEDKVSEFVLDNNFEAGTYFAEVFNIGNTGDSKDGYNYVNSKTIHYSKIIGNNSKNTFVKLMAPTDLNINDGINLRWTDNNEYTLNQYILNITQNINNVKTKYSGIISSPNYSAKFSELRYYSLNNVNYLMLSTDDRIEIKNGKPYFGNNELFRFTYEGSFDVTVQAYGDDAYITSDISNSINIVLPDPVSNLKIEHGRISWTAPNNANGFILSISRTLNGISDAEYNKFNKLIYVSNQNYYNLTDVGYTYRVSVCTYSLIDNETNQTMASEEVVIENYEFNSFTNGNGTKENPYLISDEDTLKLISYNNFATYKIIDDITLTENFSPMFDEKYPFIGTILGGKEDGTTPTIYNLKIPDNTTYGGMLGYMSTDTLVDDRMIETNVGGILTDVRTTTEKEYISCVENINFYNVEIISGAFVGTIAGFSSGNIKDITIYGLINSNLDKEIDAGASKYNIYSGSVVGRNAGTIQNINNYAEVMPTSKTGLITGGIAGENLGTIQFANNYANVLGSISGGIVGDNSGLIEASTNFGDVTCASFITNQTQLFAIGGGLAGANRANGKIVNCIVNNNNFNVPAGEGGVLNMTNDVFNSAPVVYIGGLVGENYGECYNNIVKIELYIYNNSIASTAGKIFGYNKNNSVQYNYCLKGTLVHASVIQSANSVYIDETNREVTSFDTNLVNELNDNNINTENSWINSSIYWNFTNDNIIIEKI